MVLQFTARTLAAFITHTALNKLCTPWGILKQINKPTDIELADGLCILS
jgi:hypothetical protein